MTTAEYNFRLSHLINEAIQEDVGEGDHSALSCIPANAAGWAILKIKESGILAGVEVAETIFKQLNATTIFEKLMEDGTSMYPGDIAFKVHAPVRVILKAERLVLNTMQRMSGIATNTRQYVNALNGYSTKLLDTRKTTPNFRLLEKAAVKIGGAYNHRFGLYDMIMLKDNHIDFCGGIVKAIEKAWAYVQKEQLDVKIEVETRNLQEVELALGTGKVDRLMLDNFTPIILADAVKMINLQCETEASGGINLSTLVDYAATGVDYISVGGLIHQARSLDMSLKAVAH